MMDEDKEYAEARARLLARSKPEEAAEEDVPAANEIEGEKIGPQMAFWPQEVGVMPTELTRAALFRMPGKGRRKMLDGVKLEGRADIEIVYTGQELDQADGDVWGAVLRLSRGVNIGQRMYTNRAALLRELKRGDTGPNRTWLGQALDRLASGSIKCTLKRGDETVKITAGLLNWGIEEESGKMFVRLDADIFRLFDNLAYYDWEQRLSLKTDGSKSLQLYASGHAEGKPHSIRLTDLAAWAGYGGRSRQFRLENVLPGLAELKEKGFLTDGRISRGADGKEIVSWKRTKRGYEA
jgi:hypothetical protein